MVSSSFVSVCFHSFLTLPDCHPGLISTMFRPLRRLPRRFPVVSSPSRALRPFTCGYPRMAPAQPPVSTQLPADAYQLLSTQQKAGEAEDALYDQQIRDVETWWSSPRYEGIKRPYSAADVVSKRGSLQQTYPSSLMARKLFNLLNERAAAGQPVHTSEISVRYTRSSSLTMFVCSGSHRSSTDDAAGTQPRNPLRLRLGMLFPFDQHQ